MKKILFTCLLIMAAYCTYSQVNVSIEKVYQDEKMFYGYINETLGISIYIKHYEYYSGWIYSVEGWYQYNKIGTKIPLVGLYDGEELILFVFKEQIKKDSILKIMPDYTDDTDGISHLKNMSGFQEKFVIGSGKGTWMSPTKNMSLKINDNDYNVINETEYLKINQNGSSKFINLRNICSYDQDFELVASSFNENNITFLLKFDYPSSPSGSGQCGEGGMETGYILLNYDKRLALLDKQRVLLESCNGGLYYEKVSTTAGINTYLVSAEEFGSDKITNTTVIINTQKPSITVKK